MIDPQARPAAYIKPLALVAVVVSALLAALLALYAARRGAEQPQPVLERD